MCDVATAVTVGFSVLGQIGEAKAQKSAAKANAQIADNNRILAERQSRSALEAGEQEETRVRRMNAQFQGAQRAAYGSSGVALDSGSPSDVLTDTAVLGELDALTVRQNARNQAYGYDIQANNFATESSLQRNAAKNTSRMLPLQIGSTIAGGASRYYSTKG